MKNILLYLKIQTVFLLSLLIMLVTPFILACLYLPKIPYLFYLFLIILISLKLIVLDEQQYGAKIKGLVTRLLSKELGKTPSTTQIFNRIKFHILARDTSLVLSGLALIFSAIFFNRF
jgi:hypothetical protein